MFQALAIHHATAEHRDEFLAFMHRVIEATSGAPGLIEFTGWAEPGGTDLYGFSRWESAEAFQAALPTIMALAPERRPEWSDRDDDVFTMELAVEGVGAPAAS